MIIKMMITFDFNPETGEYTPIKKELVKEKAATKKVAEPVNESKEPQLILDDNKYTLNKAAVEFMNIDAGMRIDIKYKDVSGRKIPMIGSADAWGTKSGNLLNKKLTVSYRGSANTLLAEYGDTFSIEKSDTEGIFMLKGNKELPVDTNIVEPTVEAASLNISMAKKVSEPVDFEENLEEDTPELNDIDFLI